MQLNPEFQAQLAAAYEAKLADVERGLVPRFKDNLHNYLLNYHSLYEVLINKGLVKADPYKNERHLSDIAVLPDNFMAETEYDQELPIRLSEYDNMLDFMVNYTAFSVSQLSLKRLKIILSIVKYVNWSSLTITNDKATTRALAAVLDKLRLSGDAMANSAVQASHDALDKSYKQLQKDLKDLADFKRDEYKFLVRRSILGTMNINVGAGKDEFVRVVKTGFPKFLPGEAFFPELVGELYDDLLNEKSEAFRDSLLNRFHVEVQRNKAEVKKIDLLAILLDGLRSVGTSSRHLDESIRKLIESHDLIKAQPKSLWERFQAWIVRLSGPKQKETMITVEIIDVNTTAKRNETIAFEAFCNDVTKKARQYTALVVRTSAIYQRFEKGNETDAYEYLKKCYVDLRLIHEKLEALDLYFKTEASSEDRSKLRGIKVELIAIKNSLSGVNQKLHEYIARKEETEQLRKLGIDQ